MQRVHRDGRTASTRDNQITEVLGGGFRENPRRLKPFLINLLLKPNVRDNPEAVDSRQFRMSNRNISNVGPARIRLDQSKSEIPIEIHDNSCVFPSDRNIIGAGSCLLLGRGEAR